ncbi:hypothetical protein GCM10009670_27930 [Citricoccus alkalitolerans]
MLNVGVDTFVDQRHADCVSDQAEGRTFDDSGVHGSAPFSGQVEPELWIVQKGAAVPADIAMTHTVHGTERSTERFRGSVSVPNSNRKEILVTDHIRNGDSHAPTTYVLGHRQARERSEHATSVIARCPQRRGERVHVDVIDDALLDLVDDAISIGICSGAEHRPVDGAISRARGSCARSDGMNFDLAPSRQVS